MEEDIPRRADKLVEYGFLGVMAGFHVVGVIPGIGKAICAGLLALFVLLSLTTWLKQNGRDPAAAVVKPFWTGFALYLLSVSTYLISDPLMVALSLMATIFVGVYGFRVFQQRAHYPAFDMMGVTMPLFFLVSFLYI